ncbi:MAG TPA: hypothetical protein DCY12_11260, partial [Candidatus Atribacteria bacterium]|nr:hypothetical protein [Candidatus Atribacteria bacterium]
MFNSFLSKFRSLLNSSNSKLPVSDTISTPSVGDVDNNRVVFSPKKSAKVEKIKKNDVALSIPVNNSVAEAQAKVIIENARRLEAEAKTKEAEIFQRLSSLNDKEKYLIQKEQSLDTQQADLKKKIDQIDETYRKQLEKLENISGLDVDKAKQLLMSSVEKKMTSWLAKKIDETKDDLSSRQEELAKEILSEALTHGVTDYVAEYTVSTITLPDEKIKG